MNNDFNSYYASLVILGYLAYFKVPEKYSCEDFVDMIFDAQVTAREGSVITGRELLLNTLKMGDDSPAIVAKCLWVLCQVV